MKKVVVILAALFFAGCATGAPPNGERPPGSSAKAKHHLQAIHNPALDIIDGGGAEYDAAFVQLVGQIGADSSHLLRRSNTWNAAEAAFGVGLLASAVYGGYSTTYMGNNLKDAAFAAASLTGLRTFLKPGDRRNAARNASEAMNCLQYHARTFIGPQSTIPAMGEGFRLAFPQYEGGLASQFVGGASNTDVIYGLAKENPEDDREVAIAKATERGRINTLFTQMVSALAEANDAETKAYEERFTNVAVTYRKIVTKLRATTDFSAGTYKDYGDTFKAEKDAATGELNGETAALSGSAVGGQLVGLLKMQDASDKYVKAKAALLACAPTE